jgi:subtilisin family serine protease
MGRFVISQRLAGKTEQQRTALADTFGASVALAAKVLGKDVPVTAPNRLRKVAFLDADAKEIENVRQHWARDIIVEPEVMRDTAEFSFVRRRPPRADVTAAGFPIARGVGATLRATVRGDSRPLEGVRASLYIQSLTQPGQTDSVDEVSDAAGGLQFVYDPAAWVPASLALEPWQGYWPWLFPMPTDGLVLNLPPLPKTGPVGWWESVTGVRQFGVNRGAGIKVGIVDTGVGPHPYLEHVTRAGSIIQGQFDAGGGADVANHGTHVTGIIAARPVDGSGEYAGVAAGADVIVVRVFPPSGFANQADIAAAIDLLTDQHQVDLINLSLGGAQSSQIELDAITHAAESGVLCVASAGNAFGQPIIFPAALPQVSSVSAVGLLGQAPAGSAPSYCVPTQADQFSGSIFLATFSNVGPSMTCTGPGVGVISTVPTRQNGVVAAPYASMNGTSMAAPVVTGVLAGLLSADPGYRQLGRGPERAQRAAAVLLRSLLNLGLARNYVGGGLISAPT